MTLWLILGLLVGAAAFWLATRPNFKLTWYEWVLAALAVILVLFSLQNYLASQAELEPRAAGLMLMLFTLPGMILAAVDAVLVLVRLKRAKAA